MDPSTDPNAGFDYATFFNNVLNETLIPAAGTALNRAVGGSQAVEDQRVTYGFPVDPNGARAYGVNGDSPIVQQGPSNNSVLYIGLGLLALLLVLMFNRK